MGHVRRRRADELTSGFEAMLWQLVQIDFELRGFEADEVKVHTIPSLGFSYSDPTGLHTQ